MIVPDTHVIIWDALAPERLSATARAALAEANEGDGLLVCDISLWEIAMLIAKGRLRVDTDAQSFLNLALQANKTRIQPITPQIAALAVQLPVALSHDPADRLLAATAVVERIPLLTADRSLHASPLISTLW